MIEYLWLAYSLCCVVVLGVYYRKDGSEFLLRLTLVLTLPGIGWLLPVFWPSVWRTKREFVDIAEQLDTITDSKDDNELGVYELPETEKETNIVPIEEALLVNDHGTRRKMMIDLLKQDSMEYLEVLQQAVENDDTETSHYAVSAIVEAKRKLMNALQDLSVRYEANRNDPHVIRSYADVLIGYTRSGFLDPRTIYKYKVTYSDVLRQLIEVQPDDETAYSVKVEADLDLRDYLTAERYALLYMERFPRSEVAFLLLLKTYYEMRSSEKLKEMLASLKYSSVRLSSKGLAVVRYWSKGVEQ
jgi:hypothetical protein